MNKRIPHDEYRTPHSTALVLKHFLPEALPPGTRVLEPCAGDGRLLNILPPGGAQLGFEIQPNTAFLRPHAKVQYATDYLREPKRRFHIAITNPPFSIADQIISKMLDDADSVYVLHRLSFLASTARHEWWTEMPPLSHLLVLAKRPAFLCVCPKCKHKGHADFTGMVCTCGEAKMRPQADNSEYAWFCWDRAKYLQLPPGIHNVR